MTECGHILSTGRQETTGPPLCTGASGPRFGTRAINMLQGSPTSTCSGESGGSLPFALERFADRIAPSANPRRNSPWIEGKGRGSYRRVPIQLRTLRPQIIGAPRAPRASKTPRCRTSLTSTMATIEPRAKSEEGNAQNRRRIYSNAHVEN